MSAALSSIMAMAAFEIGNTYCIDKGYAWALVYIMC